MADVRGQSSERYSTDRLARRLLAAMCQRRITRPIVVLREGGRRLDPGPHFRFGGMALLWIHRRGAHVAGCHRAGGHRAGGSSRSGDGRTAGHGLLATTELSASRTAGGLLLRGYARHVLESLETRGALTRCRQRSKLLTARESLQPGDYGAAEGRSVQLHRHGHCTRVVQVVHPGSDGLVRVATDQDGLVQLFKLDQSSM
ncbi:unnamed protein product [Trichogramma brassicae]|uniref:Uncharacterized protein n=1 Tax=Trichogramma brassicae TaxID=86971 RepID=A0A6H5HUG3_9HYME|nr:unnamed protein product [Trichogramma brassicae]